MGTELRVEMATVEHAHLLAASMRPEDAAEVLASAGLQPLDAVLRSLECSSESWALYWEHDLLGVFGVAPLADGTGAVWVLTSTAVTRHRRGFVHASPVLLRFLLERHQVLTNHVDARYAAAVRWIRWLGAEVSPAAPWGVSGLPFHQFVFRRKDG